MKLFKWGINNDCPDLLYEYHGHIDEQNDHLGVCLRNGRVNKGFWSPEYLYNSKKLIGDDYEV